MENIVIFGVGQFYQNRKRCIPSDFKIVAYIDNNYKLHGKYIDGIPINCPNYIHQLSYESILLMSVKKNANIMKQQLIDLGVEERRIYYWDQFYKKIVRGVFKLYCADTQSIESKKKVLIVSMDLSYTGGTIVILYAAKALQNKGYYVVIAASNGNKKLISEIQQAGINVMLCLSLPNVYEEEMFWIQQFDIVLVNLFPMIKCACEISKTKPVLWWIHEANCWYSDVIEEFNEYANSKAISRANIYAVSKIAKKNFDYYFPERIKEILGFGIPDEKELEVLNADKKKMIFAVIGSIIPIKAQDIFIRAVKLLKNETKKNAEFWLIGSISENEYGKMVRESLLEEPSIKIVGELTREEIKKKYAEIDVVVCPSLEEPMSIAIMEGMMHGKVCLASGTVGMTDYIEEGKNGFICKTGDCVDLSEKMSWIIEHREQLGQFRINARKTYEEYFTMDKFADKLEAVVLDTINKYDLKEKFI